jgi:hypothetical protein
MSVQGHVERIQNAVNIHAIRGKNLASGETVFETGRCLPILEHVGQLATGLEVEVHRPNTLPL